MLEFSPKIRLGMLIYIKKKPRCKIFDFALILITFPKFAKEKKVLKILHGNLAAKPRPSEAMGVWGRSPPAAEVNLLAKVKI